MKRVFILTLALVALVGCASIKQAKDDYQLGKETPLAAGEISPKDQAQNIGQIISVIPGGAVAAPYAVTVLTGLFAFLRGRRIRKGIPASTNPATGFLGSATGLENVVQTISTVIAGAFEVGSDNSPLKRAWKVSLASLLGLGTLAVTMPSAQAMILAHPDLALGISGLSGLFGGLEKALSNVKPVVAATTSPVPAKVGA
jgi:hypothetical protein